MKLQPRDEPGELLYRFYKKWVASFVATIFKAGITAGDKDIHKARVFLKKIFALLSFFEILEASGFMHGKYSKIFRDVFMKAGRVREIQVNLMLLEHYSAPQPKITGGFATFLEKELKKAVKAFTSAIVAFPVKKLRGFEKAVKDYCRSLDQEVISEKSYEFLLAGALKIGYLAEHSRDEADIHRIRKELKKMKAVSFLLCQIESGRERGKLIKKLEKAEIMIGEWHDLVVFADYLDLYLDKPELPGENNKDLMLLVKGRIAAESSGKLTALLPMVVEISSGLFGNSLPGKMDPVIKNKVK